VIGLQEIHADGAGRRRRASHELAARMGGYEASFAPDA